MAGALVILAYTREILLWQHSHGYLAVFLSVLIYIGDVTKIDTTVHNGKIGTKERERVAVPETPAASAESKLGSQTEGMVIFQNRPFLISWSAQRQVSTWSPLSVFSVFCLCTKWRPTLLRPAELNLALPGV